jgi:hypothetical protein
LSTGVAGPDGRERERAEADTPEALSTGCGVSLADRLVVVVKLLLAGVGVERRGRLIRDMSTTINHDSWVELWEESEMNETKHKQRPFAIPKLLVWEAWRQVKANRGAPGVDEQELEEFEADLKNNLYRVWNRMSSGSYFPPAVLAVEIPKPHGVGVRVLGVPTVADRVAQTVVAKYLEPLVEPRFRRDSYGYRPGRSALEAVGVCRERCWKYDWGKRRDKTVMKERMRTPYIEGLATHDVPESCVGDPQGRSEAWTGARAGWAIEPRNQRNRGADAVPVGGRQHRRRRDCEALADPARSENLCMYGAFMSENRESPRSPVVVMTGRAARRRPRP